MKDDSVKWLIATLKKDGISTADAGDNMVFLKADGSIFKISKRCFYRYSGMCMRIVMKWKHHYKYENVTNKMWMKEYVHQAILRNLKCYKK